MNSLVRVAVAAGVTAVGLASISGGAAAAQPQGCILGADFQGHEVPQQQAPNGYIGGTSCSFVTSALTDWGGAGSWTIVWGHYVSDPTGALTFVQDGKVHDAGLPMTSRDGAVAQQIPAGETVFAYIDWQGTNGGTLAVGNAG